MSVQSKLAQRRDNRFVDVDVSSVSARLITCFVCRADRARLVVFMYPKVLNERAHTQSGRLTDVANSLWVLDA